MSFLEEKRQSYVKALNDIKQTKLNKINEEINNLRLKLIAEIDHSDETRLEELINAIDKVIAYEKNNTI